MKVPQNIVLATITICMLMMAQGCIGQDKTTRTGFLSNYSGFKPGPEGGVKWGYVNENANLRAYNKILLEPVVFYLADQAKYKGIDPDELNKLANEFHKDLIEAVSDAYPLVSEPGPGVMRVRIAITDLVPNKPILGSVTAVLPASATIGGIKQAVTGVNTFVGQAALEAEILDSQTNVRLAAAVDRRVGKKYEQFFEGMEKWGHVEEAFKWWAKRFRDWLDEVHDTKYSYRTTPGLKEETL